jgi:hypothetical protein
MWVFIKIVFKNIMVLNTGNGYLTANPIILKPTDT